MKVYIVTNGEYSDYHIDRVFSNRTKAAYYCAVQNARHETHMACDNYRIEEFELSDKAVEISERKEVVYLYTDEDDGVPIFGSPSMVYEFIGFDCYSIASAKPLSQEKLKKIVEDLRTRYLAEKEGLI